MEPSEAALGSRMEAAARETKTTATSAAVNVNRS
jgi:hypothetical protein